MSVFNKRVSLDRGLSGLFFLVVLLLASCSNDDSSIAGNILNTGTDGSTSFDPSVLEEAIDALPLESVSIDESDGLIYMREEEKLAGDTYAAMFDLWGSQIFVNISNSEQTHTGAVLLLLERYAITDPVATNGAGVFVDANLQGLYDTLTAQGSASMVDALMAGAAIEEIDIIDIDAQLDSYVDNQDIILVYENLLRGSRNHLRAFVRNLEVQGITYQPQYLSQDVYDSIISTDIEAG